MRAAKAMARRASLESMSFKEEEEEEGEKGRNHDLSEGGGWLVVGMEMVEVEVELSGE